MKKLAKTFLKALANLSRPHLAALAVGVGIFPVLASNGAAATCTVPSAFFATIQSAIDNVLCQTINVLPGTYTEQLTINRDLKLKGSGPSLTVIQAPASMTVPKAIIRVTGASTEATIEQFTIQGPGPADQLFGIRVDGDATATIRNNRILAIRQDPLGGAQNFAAVFVGRKSESQVGHGTITGNHIEDYQKGGIVVDNAGSTAAVSKNVVQGGGFRCCGLAAQNGIQVSRGAVAKVDKNKVSDNMYDPAVAASGGILIFEAGDGVEVAKNKVDANDVGVWVIGTNNSSVDNNQATNSTFDGIALDNQNFTAGVTTDFNVVRRNRSFGNGTGIGLYTANSNLIERNIIKSNAGSGIVASFEFDFQDPEFDPQPDSSTNVFLRNGSSKNGDFGILDESAGGGTGGTANTYAGNHCTQNTSGDSDPAGLCD